MWLQLKLVCRVFFRISNRAYRGVNQPLGSPPFLSPLFPVSPLPTQLPLKSSLRSGERYKLPQQGIGGAPAEIEFGAS